MSFLASVPVPVLSPVAIHLFLRGYETCSGSQIMEQNVLILRGKCEFVTVTANCYIKWEKVTEYSIAQHLKKKYFVSLNGLVQLAKAKSRSRRCACNVRRGAGVKPRSCPKAFPERARSTEH